MTSHIQTSTNIYFSLCKHFFKIYFQGKFQPECAFRERREANKFDTYASEYFSDHVTRKGFYLGIAPNGKIKRLKKYSWWQRRSQWLPRPP